MGSFSLELYFSYFILNGDSDFSIFYGIRLFGLQHSEWHENV